MCVCVFYFFYNAAVTRHTVLVIMVLDCRLKGRGIESRLGQLHFDKGEMLEACVLKFRHMLKKTRWSKISQGLHFGVPHSHIAVLACKTPIIIFSMLL